MVDSDEQLKQYVDWLTQWTDTELTPDMVYYWDAVTKVNKDVYDKTLHTLEEVKVGLVPGLARHQIYPPELADGTFCVGNWDSANAGSVAGIASILHEYDNYARYEILCVPLVLVFREASYSIARIYISHCVEAASLVRRGGGLAGLTWTAEAVPLYCKWYYWPPGQGSSAHLRVCFDYAGLAEL